MHDCWNELCLCQTGRIALSINFLCDASPNVSCFPGEKIMDRTKKKKKQSVAKWLEIWDKHTGDKCEKKITRNVVINVTMTKSMPSFCVLSLSS